MTRPARLIVDPIACDGRGLCAELLPSLITLDDWGFPVIFPGDIPPGLQREAAAVARLCPRLALRLERAPRPDRDACTGERGTPAPRRPAPARGRIATMPADQPLPPEGYESCRPAQAPPVVRKESHSRFGTEGGLSLPGR